MQTGCPTIFLVNIVVCSVLNFFFALICRSQPLYPLVVAAHPLESYQFAIGLSDGSVKVIEPIDSEGKWGTTPPIDNGVHNGRTGSSSTTSNHTPDQAQR